MSNQTDPTPQNCPDCGAQPKMMLHHGPLWGGKLSPGTVVDYGLVCPQCKRAGMSYMTRYGCRSENKARIKAVDAWNALKPRAAASKVAA